MVSKKQVLLSHAILLLLRPANFSYFPFRFFMSSSLQKKSAEGINSRLKLVVKTGKYSLGYRSTLKTLRSGKAKMVIIANNCPPLRKSEIEYLLHHFSSLHGSLPSVSLISCRICYFSIPIFS